MKRSRAPARSPLVGARQLRPRRRPQARARPVAAGQAADGADDADARRAADPARLCPARPGRRADQALAAAPARPVRPAAADGGAAPAATGRNRPAARLRRDRRRRLQENRPDMPTRVRKAVFPVAGLGTRLLPATKSIPKEMITVVDRPLIQYAVDEAREAGIEQMIFVTGRGKVGAGRLFRHGLRARDDDARDAARASTSLEPSRAGFGEIVTRPPAAAARPRPRRLVRARTSSATSRSRCCFPTS